MVKIIIKGKKQWFYPPTTNKSGIATRGPFDIKEFILIYSDLFILPTLIMSDLHSHSFQIANSLNDCLNLDKFVVLCAGDMTGEGIFGSDGNPFDTYKLFAEQAKEFYFVQGNHDLPSNEDKQLYLLNKEDKFVKLGMVKKLQV